ncbi:MAG: hypothetical protein HC853_17885 [Anaerolineae bacterium]|nr:hypothetical protein [Anaerolineae bacterium]
MTDVGSGMRVFRRSILDKLYPLPDGLNFTPVMSVRAVHENIKLVEISSRTASARAAANSASSKTACAF